MDFLLSLLYLPFTVGGWVLGWTWPMVQIILTNLVALVAAYIGILLLIVVAIILLSMCAAVTSHLD
jgi:hypothetical protein